VVRGAGGRKAACLVVGLASARPNPGFDAPVLADPHQPGSLLEHDARVSAETSQRLTWGAPLK